MFRISIVDKPSRRTLVVEGTLVGPWVAELRKSWSNASRELGGRKLVIDLSSLTGISREGEEAIFDLMKTGARFSCAGVLMSDVLKQLARKKPEELPRR
jgi:anti-anti-sigma regulatory factor